MLSCQVWADGACRASMGTAKPHEKLGLEAEIFLEHLVVYSHYPFSVQDSQICSHPPKHPSILRVLLLSDQFPKFHVSDPARL